jgi:Xaa-Pro aminopeptidase
VERFKQRDLWRKGALEEIRKAEEADERAAIRAELLAAEQREDEVALAFRAAKRVNGDRGEHRRFDRMRPGVDGVVPYAGGVSFPKQSEGGLLIPAGAS